MKREFANSGRCGGTCGDRWIELGSLVQLGVFEGALILCMAL